MLACVAVVMLPGVLPLPVAASAAGVVRPLAAAVCAGCVAVLAIAAVGLWWKTLVQAQVVLVVAVQAWELR